MLRDFCPKHYGRYEASRFSVEFKLFADWLHQQGHLRDPARGHLFRLARVLEQCDRFLPGDSFSEPDLRVAFAVPGRSAYLYLATRRIFVRYLAATGRLTATEATDARELLCIRYRQYLSDVRGFSAQSIKQHSSTLKDFLCRGVPTDRGLCGLVTADIEAYVQLKSKENTRQSLQHVVAQLRAFLRYSGDRRETAPGLNLIDTPRTYRDELPPRALDWVIVRRLLVSFHRRSPREWRDHTILHLMAYYGLRPSEVASLQLNAIDWDARTLRVDQRKTRSTLVLPMADRTLRLLRRYLIVGRPCSELPDLFLRIRSPIKAMKHYGVIEVFMKRARDSGLPIDGASCYALRHAFAMRLLRRGVGVKAIGDLLGHRSLEATCVYLRLDVDMLRTVGLPVPAAAFV